MKFEKLFSLPFLFSVFLHATLLALIILRFDFFKKEPEPYQPHFVTATLIDTKPKAKPAPQQVKEQVLDGKKDPELKQIKQQKEQEQQEAETKAQEKTQEIKEKAEAQAREEKVKLEKAKKEAEEKAKAEKQKKLEEEQKQAEAEKKKKLEKQRKENQKALEAALQKEEQMISSTVDDVSSKSYEEMIAERVSQNWSRPPSARNGMAAQLEIRLLPNGQVVGVRVVTSSGFIPFDRSAEQAVRRVDRFEEVKNIPPDIFEKHFRVFLFTFSPGDLRQ